MIVSKYNTPVTPNKGSGSTSSIHTPNPSYRIRWKKQAQRALQKSKRGGHLDRRERRLIQKFKAWEAAQRQQQQQSTSEELKAAA